MEAPEHAGAKPAHRAHSGASRDESSPRSATGLSQKRGASRGQSAPGVCPPCLAPPPRLSAVAELSAATRPRPRVTRVLAAQAACGALAGRVSADPGAEEARRCSNSSTRPKPTVAKNLPANAESRPGRVPAGLSLSRTRQARCPPTFMPKIDCKQRLLALATLGLRKSLRPGSRPGCSAQRRPANLLERRWAAPARAANACRGVGSAAKTSC